MADLNLSTNYKAFVETLFKGIEKGDLEYIYKGEVTSTVVTNILDLAKLNMSDEDVKPISSRIYFILGEGLQNISIHQDKIDGLPSDSIIFISKKLGYYTITTGNLVKTQKKEELEDKLNKINSMTVDELREFARYIRKNFTFSEKGGANLGLVEMAKRSGSQLVYGFNDIVQNYTYFYFSIELNLKDTKPKDKLITPRNEFRNINFLKKFHHTLDENNIYLVFKGDFHQNNILALFDILRKQIAETSLSIKLKNVLIEVLQNIEKHGDNLDDIDEWKPGMVTVHQVNEQYYLTSANYIKDSKIEFLKSKLDSINNMTQTQLSELYRKSLLDFETEVTAVKTGLGFIDICRRTGTKLLYEFSSVEDGYSIFYIQISIK